jgi:hypothetical protein
MSFFSSFLLCTYYNNNIHISCPAPHGDEITLPFILAHSAQFPRKIHTQQQQQKQITSAWSILPLDDNSSVDSAPAA